MTIVLWEMSAILVLCPVLFVACAQTLTIDSVLGTSVEDCFERISIGEQLPPDVIYRNITELTTAQCEAVCKEDRQCLSYDYGVGAIGNATCNLSNLSEKQIGESKTLLRNTDYDVYVRRVSCEQPPPSPLQPQFDEPSSEPNHRPIFRPGLHDINKQPPQFSDEPQTYDLRPHETNRPYDPYRKPNYYNYYDVGNTRPSYIDHRPDDYTDYKPELDGVLGYGLHRPQEIPYRPNKPYRPNNYYNNSNQKPRPDPYDELHFQDQYNYMKPYRPQRPGYWRPDPIYPHRPEDDIHDLYGQKPIKPITIYPERPVHLPDEKPPYQYFTKPTKRPVIQRPGGVSSGYGDNPDFGDSPIRPDQEYNKPGNNYYIPDQSYNKPNHDSNRPDQEYYKPTHNYNRPDQENIKPDPVYNKPEQNYNKPDNDYNRPSQTSNRPDQNYNRPNYEKPSYNKPEINQIYTPIGPPHGDYERPSYGQFPNKPLGSHKPGGSYYGEYASGYGQNQDNHIYVEIKDPPNYYKPSYPKPIQANQGYGSNKPDYSHYGYGQNSHSQFDNNYSQYGHYETSHNQDYNRPYQNKPSYGGQSNQYGYGDQSSYFSSSQGQSQSHSYYGASKPGYGTIPNDNGIGGYGSQDNGYGTQSVGYGNQASSQDFYNESGYKSNRPGFTNNEDRPDDHGNRKPINGTGYAERPDVKPVYEYELSRPSGGYTNGLRPDGQIVSSRPVSISDYGGSIKPGEKRDPVSYKACFRRVLAGQRALRSHVRRVMACERLEDCRRECATEKRFNCESFNYRIDPSFRGKGLCEMMTKPIEAFDIRRDFVVDKDYDFYEKDRNSLEPNCPTTLRGPGYLHSGYLTSNSGYRRPAYQSSQQPGRERYDYWNQDRNYNRRYQGNRYNDRHQGRRRYEDQFFVPYQIGIGRSDDDFSNWGQYGGYYGGNHYNNGNDYKNLYNHWGFDEKFYKPNDFYGVKPYTNENDFDYHSLGGRRFQNGGDNYGYGYGWNRRSKWNMSTYEDRNGLVYGESNFYGPGHKEVYYEEPADNYLPAKDCSTRRKPGMSLSTGAIKRSLLARSVLDCEAACFNEREFRCVSYSYRYSKSQGSDNCFLSERPYRGLEMAADSGSDVYTMPQDSQCPVSQKPWVESECFWHVRSSFAVGGRAVLASLSVPGLGACEAECIRAHDFFCRGFSFRFDSPTIGDDVENCLLTSSPPTSLQPSRGLRKSPGHELYARGNYGRGCEPALYDEIGHREKQCYLQYDSAARLSNNAVRGTARVRDKAACGEACNEAPFRCLSFSFTINAPPDVDNCFLSEVRLFDLQNGVDYETSPEDSLFAFDLFNGECSKNSRKPSKGDHDGPSIELPRPIAPIPSRPHPVPGTSPDSAPGYIPSAPGYIPSAPGYLPSGPPRGPEYPLTGPPSSGPGYLPVSGPSGPGYKPESGPSGPGYQPGYPAPLPPSGPSHSGYIPRPPIRPGYEPDPVPVGPSGPIRPPRPIYGPPRPAGPGYGPGYPDAGREPGNEIEPMSWRHYTVSGYPCRRGTSCAQNVIAGHWACEPEGGEIGSWDYCCAPTHRCGYSEGFHKPWCYVGPSTDQWRPCSEKYYPYHQHKVPHPSQGQGYPGRPWSSSGRPDSYLPIEEDRRRPAFYPAEGDRKYWDDLYENGPKAYYDKYGNPLPGYARVPTENRPYIRYHYSDGPRPGDGSHWVPLSRLDSDEEFEIPVPGGLGIPRYWPVAYLHKGPPPNVTYFRYNATEDTHKRYTTTTEKYIRNDRPIEPKEKSNVFDGTKDYDRPTGRHEDDNFIDRDAKNGHRDEKNRNMTAADEDVFIFKIPNSPTTSTTSTTTSTTTTTTTTTPKSTTTSQPSTSSNPVVNTDDEPPVKSLVEVETVINKNKGTDSEEEALKDITGKLDFSGSIEVFDIEEAKKDAIKSNLKTIEAEERQIEAIGRLLASRRDGKLVIEKRSQNDLQAKKIAVDRELAEEFDFGNKFPTNTENKNTERRGIVQRVSKEELAKSRIYNDKSLEVSETTFVRPPRVLATTTTTTENIRKAYLNGKVFYDATIREQRDLFAANATRKQKALSFIKVTEDSPLQSLGKKKIRQRNTNPVRRARRIYRKRYNPEEVRKRLLEREKLKQNMTKINN